MEAKDENSKQNVSKSIKARDYSGCYMNNNDKWGIDKIFEKKSQWRARKKEQVESNNP